MNETNDIIRMVMEHWIAVTPGYNCKCGHTHHGRQLVREHQVMTMAPQYGFCDDEVCACDRLQRVAA